MTKTGHDRNKERRKRTERDKETETKRQRETKRPTDKGSETDMETIGRKTPGNEMRKSGGGRTCSQRSEGQGLAA